LFWYATMFFRTRRFELASTSTIKPLAVVYPQHLVVVRGAADLCDEHPHPVPPLDFTAASWAQHALTPAGAGPPQQLSGCVFRDWSELVVV
jgi:hypothetical protein